MQTTDVFVPICVIVTVPGVPITTALLTIELGVPPVVTTLNEIYGFTVKLSCPDTVKFPLIVVSAYTFSGAPMDGVLSSSV